MDILRGLDAKEKEIDLKIKPDGTRKYPARTCYDLFLDHKSYKSGKFQALLVSGDQERSRQVTNGGCGRQGNAYLTLAGFSFARSFSRLH